MNINLNDLIEQTPASFQDSLGPQFEQHQLKQTIPFKDLPLTDYKILSINTFTIKDKRDCMIPSLLDKNSSMIDVFAPDCLRNDILTYPTNQFNYSRILGLRTSQTT